MSEIADRIRQAKGAARCPDCDCPNPLCACVLLSRVRSAERDQSRAIAEAAMYRSLFQAAASLVAHNRDRLRKPRGKDEERVLAYLDDYGAPGLGPFWSGKTDGWIEDGWPVQGELALEGVRAGREAVEERTVITYPTDRSERDE